MSGRRTLAALLALTLGGAVQAAPEFAGQLRAQWADRTPATAGPLAQADGVLPGSVLLPASGATLAAELRASGHGITAVATLQSEQHEGQGVASRGWFNELNVAGALGGWRLAAGKKIVGWDVGYGFRPNDVVQQEERRPLLATTAEGRPLAMAEHFDADTAWSFVWVNPTHRSDQRGGEEPALAARVYRRIGALDWHGFARAGARNGGSVGSALAWVAGDSLELHASLRLIERADTLALAPGSTGLARSDPWQVATAHRTGQALLGGTWTSADQLSLLAEAWWDGTALSNAQWDAWNARNRALGSLIGAPLPPAALAGNLAWQANAFAAAQNLRRANLFARLSWQSGAWQPALDLLFTPADAGRVVTASLGWQGDRWRVDAGWRVYGGPRDALFAQLPTRRLAYLAATLPF